MTAAKKAMAVLMAAILCLSMALAAMPGKAYAAGNATLTVSGVKDGLVTIYKMFDAAPTADGDGATYAVAEGWNDFFSGLDGDASSDPYGYLAGIATDKDAVARFAAQAVAWAEQNTGSVAADVAAVESGNATFSDIAYGYYLVVPAASADDGGAPGGTGIVSELERYSEAMLVNVLGNNVSAAVKAEYPTVDKTIVDNPEGGLGDLGVAVDDSWEGNHDMELDSLMPYSEPGEGVSGTSANVGDTLTFKLESKVPDMSGYSNYTFILRDTLSDGLTLLNSADDPKVVVNIGGNSLDGNVYTATGKAESNGTTTLAIDLSTYLTGHKDDVGKTIEVYYQAKVNDKALVEDPETNEAYVEYSNNPSSSQTGTSVSDKTYTYTFGFDLKKVIEDTETTLPGAKFVIYRDGGDGSWSDGTGETGLTFTGSGSSWELAESQGSATELMTGADGLLSLDGLSEGIYWVVETAAPDGYNKLSAPIKVVISATYNEDGTLASHTISYDDSSQTDCVGGHVITIENSKGTLLPETGGMGTVALTAVGVIVLAAGVVLVIRRSRKADQR